MMTRNENGEKSWNGEFTLCGRGLGLTNGAIRKLGSVLRELKPLVDQGGVEGFFSNTENVNIHGSLVEDIRDAIMDYQVFV